MQNRDVFVKDPTTSTIPNDGVAVVTEPQTPEEWEVLRYELSTFVCEGEYREGLHRILSTYLAHLSKPKQPAVWVNGFYGSGKSHLARVLQYLWNDVTFPDGAQARGLTRLPQDITDLLKALTAAGQRHGGLWSAAGKLEATPPALQTARSFHRARLVRGQGCGAGSAGSGIAQAARPDSGAARRARCGQRRDQPPPGRQQNRC